jgi:hypothetical protein
MRHQKRRALLIQRPILFVILKANLLLSLYTLRDFRPAR